MLAEPAFAEATPDECVPEPQSYSWQVEEVFPIGSPALVYLASVDDFATGEGLTVYFTAVSGRSEHEVRRRLAREWGAPLADRAWVALGIDTAIPFAPVFVTPVLRAALGAFDPRHGPAVFNFFAHG